MMRLRKCLALAVVALAGCSSSEIASLESVVEARRAERDSLARRAEHLDEAKATLGRAKLERERVALWRSDGDPAMRMSTLAKRLGSARASYERAGMGWKITLSGTGGASAAMAALARTDAPGFEVARIDASAPSWTAELRTHDSPTEGGGVASAAAHPTMPPAGAFPSLRRAPLRKDIERLDREIAELERLVGAAAQIDGVTASIERELEAAESDPRRLGRVLRDVQPLFAGRTPLLASGTVDVSAAGYVARGVAAPGVTGETFAARKPAGWELRKLEGAAIEVSFAAPQP